MIAGILGIILGVCIFVFRDDISDFIFKHTATVENIKTNVSDDIISPLGNDTVLDLSRAGDFIMSNAGPAKSFTFGGETIELEQFTQRDDITVMEIARYLENLSTVSDLDGYIEVDKITNISASKFEEMINKYIENTMKAEENSLSFKFSNGDEIEVISHVPTTDITDSDHVDEVVRIKPNTLEIKIYFSPRNEKGEETWTKENTFISYVELILSNEGQGQATPYGINGEKIIDTYINFEGNKSVAVWKTSLAYGA